MNRTHGQFARYAMADHAGYTECSLRYGVAKPYPPSPGADAVKQSHFVVGVCVVGEPQKVGLRCLMHAD